MKNTKKLIPTTSYLYVLEDKNGNFIKELDPHDYYFIYTNLLDEDKNENEIPKCYTISLKPQRLELLDKLLAKVML